MKTIMPTSSANSAKIKCAELPVSITTPADIGGLTSLTIQHTADAGASYQTLTNQSTGGTNYSVTLAASKIIPLDPTITAGLIGEMRLVGNTSPSVQVEFEVNFV